MKRFFASLIKVNASLSSDEVVRKKTFISFLIFFILGGLAVYGWSRLRALPLDHGRIGGVQKPLRKVLAFNEKVFGGMFSEEHLVKTYPPAKAAKKVRVNGNLGMGNDFDAESWKLQVVRAGGDTLFISLDDIKKLPKTEIIYDFKCIEGWSQVSHWGGVTFSNFIAAFKLQAEASLGYVGLVTPDRGYYVGIDMRSALHPQTILCYEMNDAPLPMNQGFPLRLIIPVKYGIKSLKRIGVMSFSNERPPDYWYERGYDYYSGL